MADESVSSRRSRIAIAGLAAAAILAAVVGVQTVRTLRVNAAAAAEAERNAFVMRRNLDAFNNRLVAQELRMRTSLLRAEQEPAAGAGPAADPAAVLTAARDYILRGVLTEENALLIESSATALFGQEQTPADALISGVAELMVWERNAESVPLYATDLPERLQSAERAFDVAMSDPALSTIAHAGAAWVAFIVASSTISNYNPADCQRVFAHVSASAEEGSPGPLPLYWQAQCERKLGLLGDALRDYARSLELSGRFVTETASYGELGTAMNSAHGVGTVLIASDAAPDSDPRVSEAMDVARRFCLPSQYASGLERMQLAEACLRLAMQLRRRLGETENQVSGSAENISFVRLRNGDFEGAFIHAQAIEKTGLFAWNELVRALTATRVGAREARVAGTVARRNIANFAVGQFNLCELALLLDASLYVEAVDIIEREHPGEFVGCLTF